MKGRGINVNYQTLSIQSADYVIFDNMPVVSDNRPVESDNMPVESDNMPVESDNMPVDSDNMPVQFIVVAKQVSLFFISLITRIF